MTTHVPDQPNNNDEVENEYEAIIPPHYMLWVAVIGLAIALFVGLTQPAFNVVGFGGLALAGLALIGWAIMAPDQLKAAFTGRTAQFGGTTLVVTVLFIAALIAIYAVVKSANLRVDLSQRESFSLTQQARDAVTAYGENPNTPKVDLLAFYTVSQANTRDSDSVLFDDYVNSSGGKITYEFHDPDREPNLAQQYGVTRGEQVVVVPLDDQGNKQNDRAELVATFGQEAITNAIMRAAATGNFQGYFLTVQDGLTISDTSQDGLSTLNDQLSNRLKWTTQQVTIFDLAGSAGLGDPNVTGEAVVIAGGSTPLPDDQLHVITDYLDKGGRLVLFAGFNTDSSQSASLATAQNLNDYLQSNFGFTINNDVVLDQSQSFQSPIIPVATNFSSTQNVTKDIPSGDALLFELSHSITVSDTPPDNVTVTKLVQSSSSSYAKPFSADMTTDSLPQSADDPTGPFTLAVSAENSQTGARIVVFGSPYIGSNRYEQFLSVGVDNLNVALRAVAWVSDFDNYYANIVQIPTATRPQDAPVVVGTQQLNFINFVTVVLLPFGILAIGLLVWYRGRAHNSAA